MRFNYVYMGRYFILFVVSIFGSCAFAQVSNCNGFIRGKYMEAGINWNGAFGSSTPPPAGYHPLNSATLYNSADCGGASATGTYLGFVTDYNKDGWTTGTPATWGDYLLPGNFNEGWSFMIDGNQYNLWSRNAAASDTTEGGFTHSIYSYYDTNGVQSVMSQSVSSGVYVTQIFSVDSGKMIVHGHVIIENTSLASMAGTYYMRTITPHNEMNQTSSPNVVCKVEHKLPDTFSRTLVTSRGISNPDAFLSIGTQDSRAVGFIANTALPTTATIDDIYAGTTGFRYNVNDSTTGENAIGIIWGIGLMPSGYATEFFFDYVFDRSLVDSTVNHHIGVPVVNRNGSIHMFPVPARESLQITGLQAGDEVIITDMAGRMLQKTEMLKNSAHAFQLSDFQNGIYIVKVADKTGIVLFNQKLQVLH